MSIVETLENLRKKKDEMQQLTQGIREELRTFRPAPIQNTLLRRVDMRRNSFKRRVSGAKELLRINSKIVG